MGNNQGNRKGTAQDQREHANQVQQVKDGSKKSSNTQQTQQVPREKGGADSGGRGGPSTTKR